MPRVAWVWSWAQTSALQQRAQGVEREDAITRDRDGVLRLVLKWRVKLSNRGEMKVTSPRQPNDGWAIAPNFDTANGCLVAVGVLLSDVTLHQRCTEIPDSGKWVRECMMAC
jgi:hypothetical protein